MRLGIFGGTFNPIHLAHLVAAEFLREAAFLERVLFVPSFLPPHKSAPSVSAAHRLAMVRLAVAGNPAFEASDLETARGGRSYAVDTLRHLRSCRPDDAFFFIIGEDAFSDIATWREAAALFSLTNFLVIPRPGCSRRDPLAWLPSGVTASRLPAAPEETVSVWLTTGGGEIIRAEVPLLEVSSSAIRARVARGLSVRYLLPDAVAAYVAGQRLYQPETKESPCP